MDIPSEAMIEVGIVELSHDNDSFAPTCLACKLCEELNRRVIENQGPTALDTHMSEIVQKNWPGSILNMVVSTGNFEHLVGGWRYAFALGLKVGQNQVQNQTLQNLLNISEK